MKLLSCYIAGFGKFVSQAFDLSKELIVIKEDNGWGKSTLADFIECMLFGMDNGRSKAVESNFRIKYAPFTGGAFGGVLTLSLGGKTYRIERQFGKTASGDKAVVYDENNACLSAVGQNGEPFGELVLKVNRDTFKKSAYIAQSGTEERGLPADTKARLVSLLSVSDGGSGADTALEKLDQADRNLRARRKPAKGKLDILDERIQNLYRGLDESQKARENAREYGGKIAFIKTEISRLEREIDELQRQKSLLVNAETRAMLHESVEEAKGQMLSLRAFFGEVNPLSVNLDGIEQGVKEYQALQERIIALEQSLEIVKEETLVKERLKETEELISSYEKLQGTGENKQEKKGKKRWFSKFLPTVFCLLGLLLVIVGGAYIGSISALGYPLFGVGLACLFYAIYGMLKPAFSGKKTGQADGYDGALQRRAELKDKLQKIESIKSGDDFKILDRARADARNTEASLDRFFAYFAYPDGYTYPLKLERLKESVFAYQKCQKTLEKAGDTAPVNTANGDSQSLQFQIVEKNAEKNSLTEEYARLKSALEREETRADEYTSIRSELALCEEEKSRLEHRLTAIRSAKELLIRARESVASKYLSPVENRCKEYLSMMDFPSLAELIFNGEGEALLRENGVTREIDYYSVGLRETLDFCVKIALFETLYKGEKPPIILDDPFVNLDDNKTEKAKKLVRALAEKYQVIYFTCKSERIL